MGCPPVGGDNPRALASGLSYAQVDILGITILYRLHQCTPCTSRDFVLKLVRVVYEVGSICNENPPITPFTNALGFNAICQTKDQSVAVIMVHNTLFYLSKFSMLQTF